MDQRMESFYVTLPSNVRSNPNNKIGSYVTNLPSSISLDSSWKVGLCNIQYTNSWLNLKNYNEIRVVDKEKPDKRLNTYTALAPGRYEDIRELVRVISNKIREVGEPSWILPALDYNPYSRRVLMRYGKTKNRDLLEVKFGRELEDLLGVGEGFYSTQAESVAYMPENENFEGSIVSPIINLSEEYLESRQCYDLTAGVRSLFVYSDVVDYSIVGDVRAQLLRVTEVPIGSQFGDHIVLTYQNPYYLPLASRAFRTIQVEIKDDSGSLIDFQFGRVELTLHFTNG